MIYLITPSPAIDRYIYTDEFNLNGTSKVNDFKSTFGGKAINVAQIIKQFTNDYKLITFGDVNDVDFINEELAGMNFSLHTPSKLRVNHKINVNGNISELNQKPFLMDKVTKEGFEELITVVQPNDYVLIAGSVHPDDLDFIVDLCLALNTEKIILDIPNITINELAKIKAFLIKPNEDEIKNLIGGDINNLEESCDILLDLGVQNMVISLGANGSYFKNASSAYRVSPIRGKVKNTVGAGDSFIGGFLSSYAADENFKKAIIYGAASGSATAFSDFIADRDYIDCLYPTVEITKQ